jgi:hypothetical protein
MQFKKKRINKNLLLIKTLKIKKKYLKKIIKIIFYF